MKLLFVYLHCDTASQTDNFCREVLTNDLNLSLLEQNYVVWAGDITHRVVYDLARTLGVGLSKRTQSFPTKRGR